MLTLVAQVVWGVESWTRHGETFAVYYNLFSRISPFETRDRVVGVRPPLGGLPRLDPVTGTVALISVMIGTVDNGINYNVFPQENAWYVQVAVVVVGHVAALTLAHDRALVLYRDTRLAVRSQYWMLGVMVGFTSLALWLLAQAGT